MFMSMKRKRKIKKKMLNYVLFTNFDGYIYIFPFLKVLKLFSIYFKLMKIIFPSIQENKNFTIYLIVYHRNLWFYKFIFYKDLLDQNIFKNIQFSFQYINFNSNLTWFYSPMCLYLIRVIGGYYLIEHEKFYFYSYFFE